MILRSCIPVLLGLLTFSAQAALVTYNNEADFIAIDATQARYDFEIASGFPEGSYDYDPAPSLIGEIDGIQFDATTISPADPPTSGSQTMTGYSSSQGGNYSAANLDFSNLSRRITGFGFYGLDLLPGESIRVTADFRLGGIQIFDVDLGSAADLTPIYFGAYDADDSILSLSLLGIDGSGNNSAWHIDDLSLTSVAAVPLPPALPLFLGGLLLLGRFQSKRA